MPPTPIRGILPCVKQKISFVENDKVALTNLKMNIVSLKVEQQTNIFCTYTQGTRKHTLLLFAFINK